MAVKSACGLLVVFSQGYPRAPGAQRTLLDRRHPLHSEPVGERRPRVGAGSDRTEEVGGVAGVLGAAAMAIEHVLSPEAVEAATLAATGA